MQEIEFDPKIFKNSKKCKAVKKDLLEQLKCRGADTPVFMIWLKIICPYG